MKHITVRLTEEEYQRLLEAQLAYSNAQGQTISLNAYIKAKILPPASLSEQ
ncbi:MULTISPECIES: hypothetical protein [unclassified Nostoc]|uniref:hypothetical protein n=1 Tax=unclassified Nostoc TaxID=2593658 RepID=UPI001E449288|nr:hypothetical protein [Nostoc sp. DedQUE03]MCC5642748.1 hypothetical protein [Nostoc sp. CHAB 5824]MDZ7977267.1 hypothetical protein [Nostoc sp. DedQUE03]MDZ8047612.1 hypothetical protein [Nostoc sp. DedQUE02]